MIVPPVSMRVTHRDLAQFLLGLAKEDGFVDALEKTFAGLTGKRHAMAVPSGQAGLYFLLSTMSGKPGDAAVSALAPYSTCATAKLAGFKPRFVDVRPRSVLMDAANLNRSGEKHPRVIIVTHPFGRVQDPDAVMKSAREIGSIVIEDITEGFGGAWKGKTCGTWGDAAFLHFDSRLNFASPGGLIALDDEEWAERIRAKMKSVSQASRWGAVAAMIRETALIPAGTTIPYYLRTFFPDRFRAALSADREMEPRKDYPRAGPEFFRRNLRGALARAVLSQVERFELHLMKRRVNARRLMSLLDDVKGVEFPEVPEEEEPAFTSFPVLVEDPRALASKLERRGVLTAPRRIVACAQMPSFRDSGADCPNARAVNSMLLNLPVHHGIAHDRIGFVARALRLSLEETIG